MLTGIQSCTVLNNIAPVKEVRIRQHTEPWIITVILQRIESRNKPFQIYKSEKSNEAFNHFKDIRNEVQVFI